MLKLKRTQTELRIINGGDMVSLPLVNMSDAVVVIDTLTKAVTDVVYENEMLQKSMLNNEESYDTRSAEAVFNDVTKNVGSSISRGLKSALATSPYHLQGQQLKSTVNAVANVYDEIAQMLLASNNDTIALARSLMAKSTHIKRDVELVTDFLDAPLNSIKRFKAEKELREELMQKGALREQAKLGTVDQDTIKLAKAIGNAKKQKSDAKESKDEAISKAKRVARSLTL